MSEMERRYGMLESARVRDITAYSKLAASSKEPMEPMPRIVIIIDELAELMMQARDSVEPSICRIAQKARAAGMHLIIGTQRPDVSVVTGLIKANIPSRIALTVKSQVDSRTMIDKAGAEKLLGNGDMLFNPIGIPEPKRVQGAFVSDEEIAAVVEYLKAQGAPDETSSEEILAEIEREAITPGERILIVDDLIATGGSASAARDLVIQCGGTVAGFSFVMELLDLQGLQALGDYPTSSLLAMSA